MKAVLALGLGWYLVAAFAACGGGGGDVTPTLNVNDPNVRGVAGAVAAVIGTYGSRGLGVVYDDFIAPEVRLTCTKDQFIQAMSAQPVPSAIRVIKSVSFGESDATADVVLITTAGDVEQLWVFNHTATVWKVFKMPGMENCPK